MMHILLYVGIAALIVLLLGTLIIGLFMYGVGRIHQAHGTDYDVSDER